MILLELFLVVLATASVFSNPINKVKAPTPCLACHPVDPNKLNVHFIPHSHDDVGWLKTVDQYFYGYHNDIQNAGVQYIISSVVEALKENSDRRFIQVETAFFWKWWQHQNDNTKQDVINLVNNGQLEIINAAWSMNDEAAVNYHSTIDQFTLGLRTINDTLGECGIPRVGWQIDPFGHSREQASIFAQLGYDGVFFARLDWEDKNNRIANKDMEVIWKGSANLDNTNIFTNIFPEFYFNPSGFCYDIGCGGDDIINDDEKSPDYNLQSKVDQFASRMHELADYYKTNNLLIPMGGDFQYQSAERNYVNMDKLIKGFTDHETVNLIYSTPSCYIQAVNDAANENGVEFTQKTDDFFPYGSDSHCYWTGYFTSRPNAKRFERLAHNVMQASKQLTAFSRINGDDRESDLTALKQAVGILQHHDAITGTAKAAVAKDYQRLLNRGVKLAEPAIGAIITNLLKKDASTDINLNLETCLMSNISICEPAKNDRFVVSVYNPLERPVTHYVRVPVPDGSYTVTGPNGEETTDLLDSISDFGYVKDIPESPSPKELLFAAKDVPALGVKLYYVEKSSSKSMQRKSKPAARFGTDSTGFEIDDDSGRLKSVTINGQTLDISQDLLYYNGANGDNNGDENRASGAYIFRPMENDASQVTSDKVSVTSTTGNLVDEVRQQYSDWAVQIIRVYKGDGVNNIEFDWLVGPIPVDEDNGIGREVISRFSVSDFNNAESFYTDSNGREMIKRTLNKRYDYEYTSENEPVASNYYPVTSKIAIKDEDKKLQVSVLNDRSQGGASLDNGQIELMVHRRLLRDDAKGVDEALNDQEFDQGEVARGTLYLTLGSSETNVDGGKSTAAQDRELVLKKLLEPLVMVGDATSDDLTLDNIQDKLNLNYDGLQATLPDNVHLLTFEPWVEDTYLLRLEHILEQNEDDTLSQAVTVDLTGLFSLFEISEIQETTLGANQWLDQFEAKEKYAWTLKGGERVANNKHVTSVKDGELEISLEPMQIRTFVVAVSKQS